MKIMKYTLWATVGLSLLFASCESILDINPKDRLTTKDYFTNEEQLQLYSNQFYSNNFPGDGDIYRDNADMLIVSPLEWAACHSGNRWRMELECAAFN